MTQRDETSQDAGTQQPLPPQPSPYLDTGEAVPQAYAAPPQPGQPSYGTPPEYRPGQRPFGSARQPYDHSGDGQAPGQPGYGQPGYGQPRYGQPRYGRPRYGQSRGGRPAGRLGPQARRDPAIAAPGERLAASILDWLIIFVVSTLAFWSPLARIVREYQAVASNYQDPKSPAAQAAFDSVFANPSNLHAVQHWLIGMFGFALAYFWVQHAAWGATVGKRAMGVRVVKAADRSRIGVRAAGIRAVTFLIGPMAFILLPGPLNVVGGLLWAVDGGLILLDSRARCLHDKLAGTIVVRQRWLDQQARSAGPW
jgi:uncharacterized RDD family membrane protein YckC